MLKTHKDDNADELGILTKGGRLASSPSNLFDKHNKKWYRTCESNPKTDVNANVIKELQSDHVLPRVIEDVTDHTKNALQ